MADITPISGELHLSLVKLAAAQSSLFMAETVHPYFIENDFVVTDKDGTVKKVKGAMPPTWREESQALDFHRQRCQNVQNRHLGLTYRHLLQAAQMQLIVTDEKTLIEAIDKQAEFTRTNCARALENVKVHMARKIAGQKNGEVLTAEEMKLPCYQFGKAPLRQLLEVENGVVVDPELRPAEAELPPPPKPEKPAPAAPQRRAPQPDDEETILSGLIELDPPLPLLLLKRSRKPVYAMQDQGMEKALDQFHSAQPLRTAATDEPQAPAVGAFGVSKRQLA